MRLIFIIAWKLNYYQINFTTLLDICVHARTRNVKYSDNTRNHNPVKIIVM